MRLYITISSVFILVSSALSLRPHPHCSFHWRSGVRRGSSTRLFDANDPIVEAYRAAARSRGSYVDFDESIRLVKKALKFLDEPTTTPDLVAVTPDVSGVNLDVALDEYINSLDQADSVSSNIAESSQNMIDTIAQPLSDPSSAQALQDSASLSTVADPTVTTGDLESVTKAPPLVDFIKEAKSWTVDHATGANNDNTMQFGDWIRNTFQLQEVGGDNNRFGDLKEFLRIEQAGGWLAAFLIVIFAVSQRNAGKEEAQRQAVEQMTNFEEKALMIAAKVREQSKANAEKMIQLEADKQLLEEQVINLAKRNEQLLAQLQVALKRIESIEDLRARIVPLESSPSRISGFGAATSAMPGGGLQSPQEIQRGTTATMMPNNESIENPSFVQSSPVKSLQNELPAAEPTILAGAVAQESAEPPAESAALNPDRNEGERFQERVSSLANGDQEKFFADVVASSTQALSSEAISDSASNDAAYENENWSTQSIAWLKRKTVVELRQYLTTQGLPITSADGRRLLKKDLISSIMALDASEALVGAQ